MRKFTFEKRVERREMSCSRYKPCRVFLFFANYLQMREKEFIKPYGFFSFFVIQWKQKKLEAKR